MNLIDPANAANASARLFHSNLNRVSGSNEKAPSVRMSLPSASANNASPERQTYFKSQCNPHQTRTAASSDQKNTVLKPVNSIVVARTINTTQDRTLRAKARGTLPLNRRAASAVSR